LILDYGLQVIGITGKSIQITTTNSTLVYRNTHILNPSVMSIIFKSALI